MLQAYIFSQQGCFQATFLSAKQWLQLTIERSQAMNEVGTMNIRGRIVSFGLGLTALSLNIYVVTQSFGIKEFSQHS